MSIGREDGADVALWFEEASYVRGDDLIAEYSPHEGFPFKTQVYWRYQAPQVAGELATLQFLLSVHTHQLDTHPVFQVWSEVAGGAWSPVTSAGESLGAMAASQNDCCGLVQSAERGDFASAAGPELNAAHGKSRVTWRLFDQFLEKGVIRRARIGVGVFSGRLTRDRAAEVCRRIQDQPTPLTA